METQLIHKLCLHDNLYIKSSTSMPYTVDKSCFYYHYIFVRGKQLYYIHWETMILFNLHIVVITELEINQEIMPTTKIMFNIILINLHFSLIHHCYEILHQIKTTEYIIMPIWIFQYVDSFSFL